MSNIPEAFVREYDANLALMTREIAESEVYPLFNVQTFDAERKDFPQVGGVQLHEKTGVATEIPAVDVGWRNRWVSRGDYWARDWLDSFDKLRLNLDPSSTYLRVFATACAMKMLQVGISGALGTSYGGKSGITPYALPAIMRIAAGGTGFTLTKLKAAVKLLRTLGGVAKGERPRILWTTNQDMEFSDAIEVKSSDYNDTKVMVEGSVKSFYGCDFELIDDWRDEIKDETLALLPKDGTTRSCIAMIKRGVVLGLPTKQPSMGKIDWDKDRMANQVSAGVSVGSTRLSDYLVVQIDCLEV